MQGNGGGASDHRCFQMDQDSVRSSVSGVVGGRQDCVKAGTEDVHVARVYVCVCVCTYCLSIAETCLYT